MVNRIFHQGNALIYLSNIFETKMAHRTHTHRHFDIAIKSSHKFRMVSNFFTAKIWKFQSKMNAIRNIWCTNFSSEHKNSIVKFIIMFGMSFSSWKINSFAKAIGNHAIIIEMVSKSLEIRIWFYYAKVSTLMTNQFYFFHVMAMALLCISTALMAMLNWWKDNFKVIPSNWNDKFVFFFKFLKNNSQHLRNALQRQRHTIASVE